MQNGIENCSDHSGCVRELNACAERICSESGVRFTPLRKRVLEIISRSHRPVKAYSVLSELSDSAKPPTVYRTLDFLMGNGLVHKLASVSAYCACFHPASGHKECFFLLCSVCGDAMEFCSEKLSRTVEKAARFNGFKKSRAVLEVTGICSVCRRRS